MAKTLIAFYSRRGENWVDGGVRFLPKGNNELIVEKIKALLPEADVFQIDTVKKYADDYMVCIEEAKQELRAKARPELTAKVENMDQYDTIILGYPNWWGVPPMAVFTFLESYDFAGKKIVPFVTSGGSDIGEEAPKRIAEISGTEVLTGGRLSTNASIEEIKDWAEKF